MHHRMSLTSADHRVETGEREPTGLRVCRKQTLPDSDPAGLRSCWTQTLPDTSDTEPAGHRTCHTEPAGHRTCRIQLKPKRDNLLVHPTLKTATDTGGAAWMGPTQAKATNFGQPAGFTQPSKPPPTRVGPPGWRPTTIEQPAGLIQPSKPPPTRVGPPGRRPTQRSNSLPDSSNPQNRHQLGWGRLDGDLLE